MAQRPTISVSNTRDTQSMLDSSKNWLRAQFEHGLIIHNIQSTFPSSCRCGRFSLSPPFSSYQSVVVRTPACGWSKKGNASSYNMGEFHQPKVRRLHTSALRVGVMNSNPVAINDGMVLDGINQTNRKLLHTCTSNRDGSLST